MDVQPYILVYGLRKRTSYSRNIPCLDVNILCAYKDKKCNELFNETSLVSEIYLCASKQAKERIAVPIDYYSQSPYNTLSDYKKLAKYLKNQVNADVIKHFKKTQYASLIPNTYVYFHTSLKKNFTSYQVNHPENIASKHRELLRDKFPERVINQEKKQVNYKCLAQLNFGESVDNFQKDYERKYYSKYPERLASDNPTAQNVIDYSSDLERAFNSYIEQCPRIKERVELIIEASGKYGKGVTNLIELSKRLVQFEQDNPKAYQIFRKLLDIAFSCLTQSHEPSWFIIRGHE